MSDDREGKSILNKVSTFINEHDKLSAGVAVGTFWGALVYPKLLESYVSGATMGQMAMQAGSYLAVPVVITTGIVGAGYATAKVWQKAKEMLAEKKEQKIEKTKAPVIQDKHLVQGKETEVVLVKEESKDVSFEKFSMKAVKAKNVSLKMKASKNHISEKEIRNI